MPSSRSAKQPPPACGGGRPCAGREGWSPRLRVQEQRSAVGLCLYATASSDQWALWCTFMFTSKRCKLVKRLWEERARLVGCDEYEAVCALEECAHRKAVEATLKRMRESELELMLLAVRSRGRSGRACVPLAVADAAEAPHVLCCRLWRWPQLRHHWELRRMPWCGTSPLSVCCNPYHWSIVQRPESPPPPYSRFPQESYTQQDRAPSEPPPGSTTIDSDSSWAHQKRGSATSTGSAAAGEARGHSDEPWCTIAYWELNERVGPLFPVRQPWLHVTFEEGATAPPATPRGGVAAQDALSLHSLARSKTTPCKEAVARTRAKIGMGVTLLHERDGVWVYNRSEHGVFVTSPTLDGPQVRNLTVFKVPPGYSLRVFDWERARRYCRCPRAASLDGPFDPNAVRISFVKGWGPRYSRQVVTALPCSLELLLRPPAR